MRILLIEWNFLLSSLFLSLSLLFSIDIVCIFFFLSKFPKLKIKYVNVASIY